MRSDSADDRTVLLAQAHAGHKQSLGRLLESYRKYLYLVARTQITNVLYINEQTPFDFSAAGTDEGVLTDFNFYVGEGREFTSIATPFVVEPLVDAPKTGDDLIVRAIGTTRTDGEDFEDRGLQSFPFHNTETFTVKTGWLVNR